MKNMMPHEYEPSHKKELKRKIANKLEQNIKFFSMLAHLDESESIYNGISSIAHQSRELLQQKLYPHEFYDSWQQPKLLQP